MYVLRIYCLKKKETEEDHNTFYKKKKKTKLSLKKIVCYCLVHAAEL